MDATVIQNGGVIRFRDIRHKMEVRKLRLGETDLPTRLRAEAERFESLRGVERAKLIHASAISQLNQSLGLLP